jgi:hypothetical protein
MARLYATAKLAIGPDTFDELPILLQYSGGRQASLGREAATLSMKQHSQDFTFLRCARVCNTPAPGRQVQTGPHPLTRPST